MIKQHPDTTPFDLFKPPKPTPKRCELVAFVIDSLLWYRVLENYWLFILPQKFILRCEVNEKFCNLFHFSRIFKFYNVNLSLVFFPGTII